MEKHELVDRYGKNTGKILTQIEARNLENIPTGCYMPVVGVVIINNKNEVLLQRRSRFKRINPSKWGICGGKVDLNETTMEAGVRETLEEIGIILDKSKFQLLSKTVKDKAHFTVYYINQDIDINKCKLQKEEVEQIQYFKIEELENLDNEGFEWLERLKEIYKGE